MQNKLWKTLGETKPENAKNSSFWLYMGFACSSDFFIHWQINLDE